MFGIQHYASFIAAILAFQLAPGAGTLAVVNAAARNGLRGGMCSVFGTLLGDFVYMTASVLGLAAILTAYPTVFVGMQWIGGAYLCWIGIGLLREKIVERSETATSTKTDGFYFRQAFAVALTNPKVVMFFMAFFPLFMTPNARPATLAALMIHVTAVCFLYQTVLVLLCRAAAKRLRRAKIVRTIAARLAGAALICFGVRLAVGAK